MIGLGRSRDQCGRRQKIKLECWRIHVLAIGWMAVASWDIFPIRSNPSGEVRRQQSSSCIHTYLIPILCGMHNQGPRILNIIDFHNISTSKQFKTSGAVDYCGIHIAPLCTKCQMENNYWPFHDLALTIPFVKGTAPQDFRSSVFPLTPHAPFHEKPEGRKSRDTVPLKQ
jgi:hypothetical protein